MKNVIAIALMSCLWGHAIAAEQTAPVDVHAAHRAMMQRPGFEVSNAQYVIPDRRLFNEDGKAVKLRELFNGERAVVVNFIFTSCTTICPVMTATMIQLQHELADEPKAPLYVSFSIDPEFDSAPTLKAYAARFGADWTFLTGPREDVLEVLQSFAAYRGAKSNHTAITLFRHAHQDSWSRVEGLASAKDLARVWKAGPG